VAEQVRASTRGPEVIDNSVMFAAGENWSTDGDYYTETGARGHLDWLRLASADGGLRLNTPSDVVAKLKARRAAHLASIVVPA
jgi:hypothetical protein